ncbi:MAG TPA: LysM peptidoglycan-binding domain-containing protein [Pirellulales bacterium]|jgi:nucleoid-associated protein YgaU|nr:LysM peptidoglycan-binding domain-containing protein [Pirellulales bacterium]
MGKEVKIGLAVIGVLLCVFGGVLFYRLRRETPDAAPKKVAAAKKDGKVKSDKKKGPTKPGKQEEGRYGRSAGQTAWSTTSNERGQADHKRAPALDASPYRDRSEGAHRNRYDDVAAGENSDEGESVSAEDAGQNLAAQDVADEEAADQESGGAALVMPNRQFVRQSGGLAFAQDDGAELTDVAVDQRGDEDARDLSIDRSAEGLADRSQDQRAAENAFDDPPESENGGEELVAKEPEARPVAGDRYSKRRYEAEPERDRLDRDRFAQDAAPEPEQMADEDAATNEPAHEAPRPFQQRPETDSYVVEPNDNFWRISQKIYGTGAYFKALEEHNRRQFGERRLINVGDVISVPPLTALREKYADLCPKPRNAPPDRETLLTSSPARGSRGTRTYTVAEGDTLFDIARHELGKASRWAEIYQLNREQLGEDFNYLSPGMQLALPERGKEADPIASRPRRMR